LYYYWKGKQVRHSVDLYVSPSDWNQEANGGVGEFRSSYGPNYKERNAYLRELMHDIDSKIMDYIKQHGEIDGDTIEAFVSGDDKVLRSDNGIDFIEFAKQRFIDRYNSGKIGVSSRENGISYMNQFAKFLWTGAVFLYRILAHGCLHQGHCRQFMEPAGCADHHSEQRLGTYLVLS
jgi:hypothetical protein